MPTQINNKLLSWATDLEESALEQAVRGSKLPFVEGHIALMPDAHWGVGATVGSVIPTKGAIIPAAVGVDIGCGMIAARTDLTSKDLPDNLNVLHLMISKAVPAGVAQGHETAKVIQEHNDTTAWRKYKNLENTAATQLGSLGSGNHFVEICLDEDDTVWIVLHSGSRGVGNKLASVHIDIAKGLMKDWFIDLEDPDLAYLVQGTDQFNDYIADMLWAQDYAMENRRIMMSTTLDQLEIFIGRPIQEVETINCHHNFTQRENHHNKNMWITRKGAIKANIGDKGVIPGSMGTRSYIVTGLGHAGSYNSCSHGAGRRMSRGQARKTLTVESLREAMNGKAWNGSPGNRPGNDVALIDEHPEAYKDIDVVMENQKDLVQIQHTLRQILNYKGT